MDIPVDLLLSIKNNRIPEDLIDGLEEQGLDDNSFASFCIIMLQQIGEKASYWKPMIGTLAYIRRPLILPGRSIPKNIQHSAVLERRRSRAIEAYVHLG